MNLDVLVEELAQAAWTVLNHDNPFDEADPTFKSDPSHASNKKRLKAKIRDIIKRRKFNQP